MPTGNERKYVLSDPAAVLAMWDRPDRSGIGQGCLPGDGRISRQTRAANDTFTYKITAGGRLIEIETTLAKPRDRQGEFLNAWLADPGYAGSLIF